MKNKLTRKLMLSAFTLLFAVISLGASTYAWFTMSTKAEVEAFEAEVKAGQGIEVAVTKSNDADELAAAQWYTGVLPADVIQSVVNPIDNEGKKSFKFDALTTTDATEMYSLNASESTTDGYIDFYIHIKVAEVGTVKLNGITLLGTDTAWTADASYQLTKPTENEAGIMVNVNDSIKYNVANATRVAIAEVLTGSPESFKIYENDYKKPESGDAGNQLGQVENHYDTGDDDEDGKDIIQTIGAVDYYNSKNSEDLNYSSASNYPCEQVGSLGTDSLPFTETTTANQVITLHVKVWIEGWDLECLNALFNQQLKVSFSFIFASKKTN